MNKILLIAGNGFIGGHLVEWLHQKYEIHILSRTNKFKCEYFNKYLNNVKFIEMKTIEELPNINIKEYYCIINLLTTIKPSSPHNIFIEEVHNELYFNNLLLKNMDPTLKYIYCSSAGTMYESNNITQNEDSKIVPANDYGLLKSFNEQLINYFHKNSIILRISNPIGYGQNNIEKKGLVTQMAINLINNDKMTLFEPDNIIKDYFDIDDLCYLIEKMLLDFKPDTYNICSGISHSINEIKNELEKLTNLQLNFEIKSVNNFDNQFVMLSNDKVKKCYSFEFNSLTNSCVKLLNQLYERKEYI